jgi:hypothetical protein
MNKGNHSILQDENLREALRQDEAALPQMPDDLNDRLMKRLHHEKRRRHYWVWPWLAAACVAAVVVWLLPPRECGDEAMTSSGELAEQNSSLSIEQDNKNDRQETKEIASPRTAKESQGINPATHSGQIAKSTERKQKKESATPRMLTQVSAPVANVHPKEQRETTHKTEELLAQEKTAELPKEMAANGEMVPTDLPCKQAKPQQVVLTERDIPISRPENYHYTPEELALMRRQANEAYMKWLELELEIMKYQQEQIAKKIKTSSL